MMFSLLNHSGELPPRARRIRPMTSRYRGSHGTTSACAENTLRLRRLFLLRWNYLRVRGEYPHGFSATPQGAELPPRARRIPVEAGHPHPRGGTTSACAENTTAHGADPVDRRNYLRVRGEYSSTATMPLGKEELPPRARRILSRFGIVIKVRGTTSACAENTPQSSGWGFTCAELPPRARRILSWLKLLFLIIGTTSACAENTRELMGNTRNRGNYLRVRGEYIWIWIGVILHPELPPRARRILIGGGLSTIVSGTTSACAENTFHQPYRRC